MGRIFPRAFAIGERLWSNPSEDVEDPDFPGEKRWIEAQRRMRLINDFNMLNRCVGNAQT